MTEAHQPLPLGLKLAIAYFLLIGVIGLTWPLLGLGPSQLEFAAKTFAYRLGAHIREGLIGIAFIAAGIAILRRRVWAPAFAYILLAIATFYEAYAFAWGFAENQPSGAVTAASFGVVGAWNTLWAYLVFRNRAMLVAALTREPTA